MSETQRAHIILRRIGALLAGLLAIIALSLGTDIVLGGPIGDPGWLVAVAYRAIYGVAGCYIAARLAPDRPMQHALALGVVGLVVSSVDVVAMWARGLEPVWFPLALVALAMPSAWAGGRLRDMQLRPRLGVR